MEELGAHSAFLVIPNDGYDRFRVGLEDSHKFTIMVGTKLGRILLYELTLYMEEDLQDYDQNATCCTSVKFSKLLDFGENPIIFLEKQNSQKQVIIIDASGKMGSYSVAKDKVILTSDQSIPCKGPCVF